MQLIGTNIVYCGKYFKVAMWAFSPLFPLDQSIPTLQSLIILHFETPCSVRYSLLRLIVWTVEEAFRYKTEWITVSSNKCKLCKNSRVTSNITTYAERNYYVVMNNVSLINSLVAFFSRMMCFYLFSLTKIHHIFSWTAIIHIHIKFVYLLNGRVYKIT